MQTEAQHSAEEDELYTGDRCLNTVTALPPPRYPITRRTNRRDLFVVAMQGWLHTEVCWKAEPTYDSVAHNIYVLIYIWTSFQIPLLQVPYSRKSHASPHPEGFWSSAPHLCHSSLQQSPMRIGKKQKARCTAAQMSGAHWNKGKQLSLDITNMCELAWLFVILFRVACSHSSAEFKDGIFQPEVSSFSNGKSHWIYTLRCWDERGFKEKEDEGKIRLKVKAEKSEPKSLSSFPSSTRKHPACLWTSHLASMCLDWEIHQLGTPDTPQQDVLLGVPVACLWVSQIPHWLAPYRSF